ncbi:hypothetical protein [Glycomyces sp. NPDC021274]|uniref:hypothetical protein n=1 Tax=Glycomyces sp. NPDC021274 TaxID=3155120 RepID=UPI0033CEBF3D
MGTSRLLLPLWLAALALHGVVGLYWYSIGPGDYRFPTPAASALFGAGIAALAWWWVRARAMMSERERELVSTRAQVRYRRLVLLVSYALGCASVAFAAGVQGDDEAWQRFTDGDPQIHRAVATEMTDWEEHSETGWTAYFDGYATIDGVRYPFHSEPVEFGDDEEVDTAVDIALVEVWAVFDPEDLDAGIVVRHARDDAEALLEEPMVPLLPFVLVIAACCWAVHWLCVRRRNYAERHLDPLQRTSDGYTWVLVAVPVLLWAVGMAWVASLSGADESYQPAGDLGVNGLIVLWMILLGPAALCFGLCFNELAAKPVTRFGGLWSIRKTVGR